MIETTSLEHLEQRDKENIVIEKPSITLTEKEKETFRRIVEKTLDESDIERAHEIADMIGSIKNRVIELAEESISKGQKFSREDIRKQVYEEFGLEEDNNN